MSGEIKTGFAIAEAHRLVREAGPELYNALAAVVEAWDGIDDDFIRHMPRLVLNARAALARARGES